MLKCPKKVPENAWLGEKVESSIQCLPLDLQWNKNSWPMNKWLQQWKHVEDWGPVRDAACEHGVPYSTLKDRVSGHVEHGTRPGPIPYLNAEEENQLKQFLKNWASVGFGNTKKDAMDIAEAVVREKGTLKKANITHGWWNRFLRRQGDLSLRRGDSTVNVRMDAINKETIDPYFSLLKEVLDTYQLVDDPAQIYNVDESGMPLDFKTPNVVAETGSKKAQYCQGGKKGQVTIVACVNAVGQAIPPMIVFDTKNLKHAWTNNEVPGSKYGESDKGWINTNLFGGWTMEHFIAGWPLLLLPDGHNTHYQPEVVHFAKDHDIIMLCLPPHTCNPSHPDWQYVITDNMSSC